MNDDARDLHLELASAYLDGDVSESERAQVESTPALLALVDELRSLRTGLADVPAAPAVSREAAIEAALAVFDTLHAAPVAPPEPSRSPASRLRWSRVLMAGAAVAVLGVVGVAALNGTSSNSRSDSAGGNKEMVTAADAAGAPEATIGQIVGPADAIPQLDSPEQLQGIADATFVDVTGGGVSESTAKVGTDTTAGAANSTPAPTAEVALPPLSFSFDCALSASQIILGEIRYQGTPAAAVRDTVTGVTEAIDGQCNVLASTAP